MDRKLTESYVCIDLETTGLEAKRDKIIEIGAVQVENNRIVREWETFVDPDRKLDENIAALTGIHDEQLCGAPQIAEVLPEVFAFIGDHVLLGHRVMFDYAFLKKAAVDNRMSFEKRGIDTLKIARKYLPQLESRGLEYLCRYYGIRHCAHRALEDARATVLLYQKLAEQFYEKEAAVDDQNLFCPRPLCYHVKRDKPVTIPQKEQLYKLADKHKLVLEYDIEKLTRSEASRQIDRLLAEYGR